jgi:uncharacterized protein
LVRRPLERVVVSGTDGARAVRLAREAVAAALGVRAAERPAGGPPPTFLERRGVFVSWYDHPERRLRGCVGYPQPTRALETGVREAAVAAALEDPRFPPVTGGELGSLVAEVSILTPFEPVAVADRPGSVTVGRDGLSVERARFRGLLLPQVAPEQGWGPEEFLDGTCVKAGLAPGAWRSADVAVYRFRAEVFRESSPGGTVVRADLSR